MHRRPAARSRPASPGPARRQRVTAVVGDMGILVRRRSIRHHTHLVAFVIHRNAGIRTPAVGTRSDHASYIHWAYSHWVSFDIHLVAAVPLGRLFSEHHLLLVKLLLLRGIFLAF